LQFPTWRPRKKADVVRSPADFSLEEVAECPERGFGLEFVAIFLVGAALLILGELGDAELGLAALGVDVDHQDRELLTHGEMGAELCAAGSPRLACRNEATGVTAGRSEDANLETGGLDLGDLDVDLVVLGDLLLGLC
jgi:hypothetical protein